MDLLYDVEPLDEDSRSNEIYASENCRADMSKRNLEDCLAPERSKKLRIDVAGSGAPMEELQEEEDTATTTFRQTQARDLFLNDAQEVSQQTADKGKSAAEFSNSREQEETAKASPHSWLSSRCLQLLLKSDQAEIRKAVYRNEDRPSTRTMSTSHCKLHNRDFSDCLLQHLKSPLQPCHDIKVVLEDVLLHRGE